MLAARLEGLEARARAALAAGHEALALEAAGAIAALEMDRAAAEQAAARLRLELGRLREANLQTARRLGDLQRGRHLARVGGALRTARQGRISAAPLAAAEATLTRLRAAQEAEALADAAFTNADPAMLEERLAAAGCGPAMHPTAESVLARLRQRRLPQP